MSKGKVTLWEAIKRRIQAVDRLGDALSDLAVQVQQLSLSAKGHQPKKVAPQRPLSGAEIRAARIAAGYTLRQFARWAGGPTYSSWYQYEVGHTRHMRSVTPEVWQRVRSFVHALRESQEERGN